MKEQVRDARAGAFVDGLLQDSRYGARVLRRNPIFTLTAALSLAIGIGATTTIFTVANALLLRASPGVANPGRLVDIVPTMKGHFGLTFSTYAVYLDMRERITTLEDVYAYQLEPKPLRGLRTLTGTDAPNACSPVRSRSIISRRSACRPRPGGSSRAADGSHGRTPVRSSS